MERQAIQFVPLVGQYQYEFSTEKAGLSEFIAIVSQSCVKLLDIWTRGRIDNLLQVFGAGDPSRSLDCRK